MRYVSQLGKITSDLQPDRFNISFQLTNENEFPFQIRDAVTQAINRWTSIIVGDLPSIERGGQTIDDLLINVSYEKLDEGVRAVGGFDLENGIRSERDGLLPFRGSLSINNTEFTEGTDVAELVGTLEHEIGHVLGFGLIWSRLGLVEGAGTRNPLFVGEKSQKVYGELLGSGPTKVPLGSDPDDRKGYDGHWNEQIFDNELMTTRHDPGKRLSRLTIASLEDAGYEVNYEKADPFELPPQPA
ncbi:MAG TPA: leishmanolysin-related zinc metalloendopeptidase [Pseudorhizobium sp.]|jgi:hypothetical protein|nr:leishmanolysin-related zinc metalloendopeptidase [Pseudorhizobium sp.]